MTQIEDIPYIGGFSDKKITHFIDKLCNLCENCEQKMVYKCLEATCRESKLICPRCQIFRIEGNHFNHSFTYIKPFFKDIHGQNMKNLEQTLQKYIKMLADIKELLEIVAVKIQEIIDKILQQKNTKIPQFAQLNKLNEFKDKIQNISRIKSLDELFIGFRIPDYQQYGDKFRQIVHGQYKNLDESQRIVRMFGLENREIQKQLELLSNMSKSNMLFGIQQNMPVLQTYYSFQNSRFYTNQIVTKFYSDKFNFYKEANFSFKDLQSFKFSQIQSSSMLSVQQLMFHQSQSSSKVSFKVINKQLLDSSNLVKIIIRGKLAFIMQILNSFQNSEKIQNVDIFISETPTSNINIFSNIPKCVKKLKVMLCQSNGFNFGFNVISFWQNCFNLQNIQYFQIGKNRFVFAKKDTNLETISALNVDQWLKACSPQTKQIIITNYNINGNLSGGLKQKFKNVFNFQIPLNTFNQQVIQIKSLSRSRKAILLSFQKYFKNKIFKNDSNSLKFSRFYQQFIAA